MDVITNLRSFHNIFSCFFTNCFRPILHMHRKSKAEAKMYHKLFVHAFSLWIHTPWFFATPCVINSLLENMVNGQCSYLLFSIAYIYCVCIRNILVWNYGILNKFESNLFIDESPNRIRKKAKIKNQFSIQLLVLCSKCLTLLRLYSMTTAWFRKCSPHLLSFNFIESFDLVGLYVHTVSLLGIYI